MKKLTLNDLHTMRNCSNKISAIKALRDGRSEVFGLGDAKLIVETLQGTVAYPHTTCSAIKCLVDYIERTTAEDENGIDLIQDELKAVRAERDDYKSRLDGLRKTAGLGPSSGPAAPVPTCVPVPVWELSDEDNEIQVLAKVTELLLGLRQTSNDAAVRAARYIDARFND